MARVLDDASRGRLLDSLLDQNIGQPMAKGQPITDDEVEEEEENNTLPVKRPVDPRGAPAPAQGNEMSDAEPMIQVPASLAHAGMAALMSQASGGRALGADGAGQQHMQVAMNDGVDPQILRKMQFLSGPTDTTTDGSWQNDRMYHGSRAGAQREGAVAGGMANSNKKAKRPE